MSDRKFHITTHPLPRAMVDDDNQHLAVSCTFDWTGDAADGQEKFNTFFEQVKSFDYWLLIIDKSVPELRPVRELSEVSSTGRSTAPERFRKWLADRSQSNSEFWTTKDRAGAMSVSSNNLKAADALRPVADWTGPVAHDGGLVRLFNLEETLADLTNRVSDPNLALIVVPFATGHTPIDPASITLANNNDDLSAVTFTRPISFTYDMDQDGTVDATFVGPALRDDTLFATPKLDLVDENTGLINLSENSQQVARILDQYRPFCNERHTLLHPMLDYLSGDDFVKAVGAATDTGATNALAQVVVDAAGLAGAMLFDPLMLTLMMPRVNGAEGGLLSHLIDALILAHTAELDSPEQTVEVQTALQQISQDEVLDDLDDVFLEVMRDTLGSSNLLGHAKRAEFAAAWSALGTPDVGDNLVGLLIAIMATNATPGAIKALKLKDPLGDGEDETDRAFVERLVAEFGDYSIYFASEAGLERTALALIKAHLGDMSADLMARSKAAGTNHEKATREAIDRFVNTAFVAFDQLLNSSFNGSEAVRQSVAALFSRAITLPGKDGNDEPEGVSSLEDLIRSLEVSVFYEARLKSGVNSGNSAVAMAHIDIAKTLWRPAVSNTELEAELKRFDIAALARFKDDISVAKFVPDSTPKPLAIQLGLAAEASEMEEFTDNYSGIGVLLRAKGEADWSCLNMAQLEWLDTLGNKIPVYPPDKNEPFVETLQPLVSNGLTNSFIGYDGIPFSSQIYTNTAVATEADIAFTPLFTIDTFPDEKPISSVPELSYGTKYELAEFAVGKGGVLPLALRDEHDPWLLTASDLNVTLKQEISFQRRTGFARPNIEESSETGGRRLGVIPSDVFPLSNDYPRQALGAKQFRDFQRGPQGQGLLELQPGDSEDILISRLQSADTGGDLVVSLWTNPTTKIDDEPDAKDFVQFEIAKASAGGKVRIRVSVDSREQHVHFQIFGADDVELSDRRASTIDAETPFFVRFTAEAAIAFDSTDQRGLTSENARKDQPLLLLAKHDAFTEKLKETVSIKVDHPAVGLTDFERWLANPDNLVATGDPANINAWLNLLRQASIIKNADEGLADALNRLPDLAVGGMLVQLLPTDALQEESFKPQSKLLPRADIPQAPKVPKGISIGDLVHWLIEELKKLRLEFSYTLQVEADAAGTLKKVARGAEVKLPEGQTASLAISLAVNAALIGIDKPLHDGFRQLATGTYNSDTSTEDTPEYLLFAGPNIALEAMFPGMPPAVTKDLQKRIEIRPSGRARRYDIVARTIVPQVGEPDLNNIWRLIAQMDVHTQRWIPSGRPIYQFIAPRKFVNVQDYDKPIVPIGNADKQVKLFEGQAFFDRSASNEQIITHRVPPLAGDDPDEKSSLITSVSWDEPTATYYRHRYTIRSRYAGAHKMDNKLDKEFERKSWKDANDLWLNRAAVLADAARLEMTRPQQRAIIPTHHALGSGAKNETAPPLISTLQEPPFAVGGLADRIVADIVIGPGYHFADGENQVTIQDLRKEIGKDPRLIQGSVKTEQAAGFSLEVEANMGLTFDDIDTSSAAFSNTAMALLPNILANNSPETDFSETHIASRLFRYLDPDWTVRDAKGIELDSDELEVPGEPIWFEISKNKFEGIAATLRFTGTDDADIKLVELAAAGDDWVVTLDVSFIDPTMREGTYKELCRISAKQLDKLIFVHAPISATQNRFMVLAALDAGGREAIGSGNQPILLASMDWSNVTRQIGGEAKENPKKRLKAKPPKLIGSPKSTTSTVFLSAPTFAEWARTGKDFGALHGVDETGEGQIIDAENLTALVDADGLYFSRSDDENRKPVWLRPQQQCEPFAQHVHRHNMVVIIAPPEGLNHAPPIFQSAMPLDRQKISLKSDAVSEGAQCVVLELESAARPLAAGLPPDAEQIADAFSRFEVHLAPISSSTGVPDEGLTFYGRFLTQLADTEALIFTLEFGADDDPKIEIPKPDMGWGDIATFELEIRKEANGKHPVAYRLINFSGEVVAEELTDQVVSKALRNLTISTNPSTTEAWFDVSMRTNHSEITELLNVWLFGQTVAARGTDEPRTMAQDLDKQNLLGLTEAQARIVSFSPRINLTKFQES